MSREAWGKSMDASDLARAEVMSLHTTVLAQMSEITELQSADRSRRRAISDLLETDYGRREEMRELRAADRTGHHTAGAGDSFTGTGDDIIGAEPIMYVFPFLIMGMVKMAPKRATRSTPVTTTPATTTTVTNAQLQAMIDQGVSAALAARDATRNGTDSHSFWYGDMSGGSERCARRLQSKSHARGYRDGTDLHGQGRNVVSTMAERQAENKRKFESTSQNNQNQQQQQNKRQNTGRAYTAGSGDKKPYGGSRPLCSK
ncbi:hypothetical protein Tco_1369420 [Tanacetum coccineum]